MTLLAPSPFMVALIQAAAVLPTFLLALPAGALADIVDRRRLLLATQSFGIAVMALLGMVTFLGLATPSIVLLATFAIGSASALNAPAFQAVLPDLVPKPLMKSAVALNSVGVNVSRALGPALGGFLVIAVGIASTFFLDALFSLGVIAVFKRWQAPPPRSDLPAERFFSAMRTAIRFTREAPELRATLVVTGAFFFTASAYWGLLPLIARDRLGGGPGSYGLLLACIGAGAIGGAMVLPKARAHLSPDRLVLAASIMTAAVMTILPFATLPLAVVLMLMAGVAWITVLSTLNVAAQVALPAWVRARGLSVYLAVLSGGLAIGSPAWGFVADRIGIPLALAAASVGLVGGSLFALRWTLPPPEAPDLTPSMHWPEPLMLLDDVDYWHGPVMIQVEYHVPPERHAAFARALERLGRIRRRDGAIFWDHFIDTGDPTRHVEIFLLDSWLQHLRQHERVTVADRIMEDQVLAFTDGQPPGVTHFVTPDAD
jgi:MFS family permease